MPKSRSTSVVVSAAVGSSITMTRAFVVSAFAISTSCWSAIESPRASRSGSRRTPSCSNTPAASRRIRLPSMRRKRFSGCVPTKMFSATLRSGKSVGSWKMIAIPAACDCFAVSKIASSPSRTSRPASGRWTPARILTSVDLPAPFSPTRPCTSPAKSAMSPSSSACTAPKLFSACSSESTGSECVVVTMVLEEAPRCAAPPRLRALEVELVDVLDREGERRPEDHLRLPVRAFDDLVLAELAGRERLADLARDRALGECGDRVARQVPEILGVPERERRHRAVVHVLLHLARQAETGERNRLLVLRGREVLRGRGDPDRRRRLDALQARVRLQHADRCLPRLSRVVVAVVDLHELHLLVDRLLQLELHVFDPCVLVRGRRGCRKNRELAGVVHQLRQQLDLAPADRLGVRLVDEELAAVHVRVERDDLRSLCLGLLERRAHGLRVVAGDDDSGCVRLDCGLDGRLLRCSGVLGPGGDDLGVAEGGKCELAAAVGDDLVRI